MGFGAWKQKRIAVGKDVLDEIGEMTEREAIDRLTVVILANVFAPVAQGAATDLLARYHDDSFRSVEDAERRREKTAFSIGRLLLDARVTFEM